MWGNKKPVDSAGGPPPPMWGNKKPDGGGGGGGPPPPMWANKKKGPEDAESGGPPPPMWGNKQPASSGSGGGGPPPPMWGNRKPKGVSTETTSDESSGQGLSRLSTQGSVVYRGMEELSLPTKELSLPAQGMDCTSESHGSGFDEASSSLAMLSPSKQFSEATARKTKGDGEEKPKKYIKQYEIGRKLGTGAYAKVKMCVDTDTGNVFAIKIFKKSLLKRRQSRFKGTAFDDVLREIAIMRKLDHENVVNMHDVIDDVFANKLYMVMDFCKHGAIMDSHEMPCQPLGMGDSRHWFADALLGLEYLHFQGVAHFDLKPDNILIGPDNNAVLADFGVSRMLKEGADAASSQSGFVSGSPGTPTYTAPEAYGDVKYDPFLADVWSFGVTLHAMVFGSLPYMSLNQIELIELITAPAEWSCALSHDDAEMMALMHGMIKKSVPDRLTLAQVKAHPWVNAELARRPRAESEFSKIEIDEEELRKAVIAGHVANFRKTPHGTLWKTTAAAEARTYKAFETAKSPVARFLPSLKTVTDATRKRVNIEMEDLTHGVEAACIMDIKMATRTFTEEDASSQELRADLLAKMLKVNQDAATPAEKQAGGITKMRYLRFREGASTSSSLGFRIDAIQLAEGLHDVVPDSNELKSIDSIEKVNTAICQYVRYRPPLLKEFALKLRELREALEGDDVFMSHSFVRTSLLFVYSDATAACSVHLIDMSKVAKATRILSHRGAWQPGNDEDGYLDGLDNMIRSFEQLSETPMSPAVVRDVSSAGGLTKK
jgi:serine/threonine protein kinase